MDLIMALELGRLFKCLSDIEDDKDKKDENSSDLDFLDHMYLFMF